MKRCNIKTIFLAMLLALITGCNNATDFEEPINVNGLKTEDQETYHFYRLCDPESRYTKTERWREYINERFNLDIALHYLDTDYSEAFKQMDSVEGLIYFEDYQQLYAFYKADMLEPLGEYIYNMDYSGAQLQTLVMEGDIYGLPLTNITHNEKTRGYRSDLSEKFDTAGIETIDSFYGFLKNYVYNYGSNVQSNNEPGMILNISTANNYLYDIQRSFECYFDDIKHNNHIIQTSISYNPNKMIFEDCAFYEGIYEYLAFIKALKDEGMMSVDLYKTDMEMLPATKWDYVSTIMNGDMYTQGSYYLLGNNTENLYERVFHELNYGIIKGTDDIDGYIDLLDDVIKSEKEFLPLFQAGIPEVDYNVYDDIMVHYMLEGENPGFNVPTKYSYFFSENKDEIDAYSNSIKKEVEAIEKYREYYKTMELEKKYSLPYSYTIDFLYSTDLMTIEPVNFNMIVLAPLLTEDAEIEHVLEEYRRQARIQNVEEKLEDINSRLSN
jgi:hypothetical protein